MFANLAAWSLFPAKFGDRMLCVMTFPEKEKKTMVSHVEIFNISASVKRHSVLATQLRNLNGIRLQMNSYTFLKKKNNNKKKQPLSCDVSIKKESCI